MASTSLHQSRNATNPGYAIAGGYVYYLYEAPWSHADLEAELQVLERFLEKWNANYPPKHPSGTDGSPFAQPIMRIVVTCMNHISPSPQFSAQGPHITAYVCTEDHWNSDPQIGSTIVHIFANDGNPKLGYRGFQINNSKKRVFKSDVLKATIAASQMRYFGKLTGGRLSQ
ncbi:hypothetical protein GGF50DRAFT_43475 [Schizophyllum commune]